MAGMIEVRDLHFGYQPDRPILRGIDLDIQEGSYVGIVGSNGSGKSTFTKHLNSLLLPTRGTVRVDGVSTSDDPDAARTLVGMVLQNPENQIVGTVVEDDVAFGPENLRLEHDELVRRVDEALARVRLESCRGRGAETLSGGQKQRLAIAGILAMRPRYVVVDEPTSMLDPVGRREVIQCLEDLHQAGVTVIHVTHLLEELLGADRILAMELGEVTFDGSPRDLFLDRLRMERLRLELPAPAALALALEQQRGITKGVPWDLGGLLEHLGASSREAAEDPREASSRQQPPRRSGQGAMLHGEGLAMEYSVGSPLQVTALRGVDLVLQPGELLGLVGSTGSGKSTLIQLLAGLLEPTSGAVHYPDDVDPRRLYRSVGVVFQQPEDQLFEPTVFEDVAYGPRQLGVPEADLEPLVRRALDLLGLPTDEILRRSPFDLSGGEKRRVAIAGILSMRPRVLIFDEPTAGLDAHARRLLQGTLQNLHESGEATVLVVSHDMDLLAEMATRIVLLHDGLVLADAPPVEVFSRSREIRRAGLEAPYPAEVLSRLAEDGWEVTPGLVGAQEAAQAIAVACRQRRKGGGR